VWGRTTAFRHFYVLAGVKYACENCGAETVFNNSIEAFKAGWDTPEQFGVCTCPACSSAEVILSKLSSCCGVSLRIEGEATQHYVCTKCGRACDAAHGNPGPA
jgi:DNA-directed RNA polymerase subunit RPC12/RpoP